MKVAYIHEGGETVPLANSGLDMGHPSLGSNYTLDMVNGVKLGTWSLTHRHKR